MNSKKNLKRNLLICLLAGSAVMYTLPLHAATSVIANNTLPTGGKVMAGNITLPNWVNTPDHGKLVMDITQSTTNGVIKWDSFDVGGSATVNFKGPQVEGGYNTLNYVNAGGSMSQIYGTINANNNGNIFIVNPAGVQIGNSAQINVGSLHVSNKNLDNINWEEINNKNPNINDIMSQGTTGNAALMSLGNINATKVTFGGDGRIVIDSERLKDVAGTEKLTADKIFVNTKDKNNVVIGYEAYDKTNGYKIVDTGTAIATVNDAAFKKENGYMWVEDVEQLQAINTNLGGNYALRNSIDATSTAQNGFNPIGLDENGKLKDTGFTGKFDGIDYNIFGLTINNNYTNVGLFGGTNGATINNVTLVGGSIIGGAHVGAVVGSALNGTVITNVVNSASVSGSDNTDGDNIGGVVGVADNSTITNAVNTGAIDGKNNNVGGLVGLLENGSTLDGNSYNLGDVSGDGYNVGGLVGHAVNSTIGDGTNLVYNRMDVTGAYNVGGIVGNMEGSTVKYAENSGTVEATGYTTEVYKYHTADNSYDVMSGRNDDDIAEVEVAVANVGGIVGTSSSSDNGSKSAIINVENSGDISSSKNSNNEFYDAGNIGGIIGRANNTDITSATNMENEIRGAHNVGGVAGYLGGNSTVSGGINDGGDIMATGARAATNSSYNVADGPGAGDNNYYGSNVNNNGFALEHVRNGNTGRETFIIGNMGGIVGYMEGDNAKIAGSANRGTVHTFDEFEGTVPDYAKAANAGGVVGKIDRVDTLALADLQGKDENNNDKILKAAVSNSYNTGDVMGYSNVGGIAGMMYNGEVAGSYNLGYISTTRQPGKVGGEGYDALNMGGIVGDTTEGTEAEALLYDVYNKGKIGDSTYTYYGRHVAGIVGRLSGDVEKAYNNGAIYNAYAATGGIAGWMYKGSINNAFNTGNITVYNRDSSTSQVGGIVGAVNVGSEEINLTNLYNLGTLRSFKRGNGNNAVGGIVGAIMNYQHNINISNAYTTGNIYVDDYSGNLVKSIYGEVRGAREYDGGPLHYPTVNTENTYYIQPDTNLDDFDNLHNKDNKDNDRDNSNKAIDFNKKHLKEQYQYDDENGHHSLTFTQQVDGDVDGGGSVIAVTENGEATTEKVEETGDWRIYAGNTPILNAFLPDAEGYFSQKGNMAGIGSIQYGTAYDPLLTIINAATGTNQLKYEWDKLGISNAAGLVVYGAGLTLDNVNTSSGSGYFGGTIYADGALNINGVKNDIGIGSAADIYGSAVNIITDGKVTIYGDVTATGNTTNDVDNSEMKVEDAGNITINAGDVDVYGTLTSATTADYGNDVKIPGIEGTAVTWNPGNVSDPYAEMSDIADRFAHTTDKSNVNGNITINAGKDKDGNAIGGGNVNIYFGNQEQGLITTGGDLQVEATGNIFVDSDLDVDGNLRLTSTGKNSEILLTLTNIGKVQADKFTGVIENFLNGKNIADINASDLLKVIQEAYPGVEFTDEYAGRIVAALKKYEKSGNKASAIEQLNNDIAVAYMHQFMHNFDKTVEGSNKIYLNADSGNAKLTVDMWDYNHNKYYFEKYDTKFDEHGTEHTFKDELDNMDLHVNNDTAGVHAKASEYVYVEVSNGAQLKAIQQAGALAYNYALMGDINASGVSGYEAIGAGSANGFTGTFDGRGNRIIGLTVDGKDTANAGIFDTIGTNGVVKDVNIYSGNFTGTAKAGAVAGENNGRIEGVVTFGNTVTVTGEGGNAGGIVGVNNGNNGKIVTNEDGTITLEPVDDELPVTGIIDVESSGSVIAEDDNAFVGGLVGTNKSGATVNNSYSNSAVTSTSGTDAGLGGVVGVNQGTVSLVDSLGVTNGTNSTKVGGVIGINSGTLSSAYNESIVNGYSNVGGIIGDNNGSYDDTDTWTGGIVENVVNATGVTGTGDYVGGLVGTNIGIIENGRNNGTITGTNYVGGMVGSNADEHSVLANLTNDSAADISGENYVGGIAGTNSGTITAQNQSNLINRGSITGQNYVGGVAGENIGTIEYVKNDVNLYVKDDTKTAQYFGGVAGINGRVDDTLTTEDETATGTITSATNEGDVVAENAQYVGGIVGWNTVNGVLDGMGNSNTGRVEGATYVGGVAGKNNADITGTADNIITIENTGVVIAHNGGAGGIFGENTGDIQYAEMSNSGIVSGTNYSGIDDVTNGTGGIIGVNSGDITYSSITNTVDGQVTGINNVGGLIGYNTGTIIGGRNEAQETDEDGNVTAEEDSYYKYKVYNNGTITVTGSGSNIGGLIGNNAKETINGVEQTGSLTAGYNTGAINAGSSSNVGGIVGNNAGKVDQVFNTVMTPEGEGAITGGNNVGGLIGTNSGTLSNAYNTTEVKPTNSGVVGNAVGENSGTITNIYASNTSGNLIGTGYDNGKVKNAYSFSDDDNGTNNITVITEDGRQNSDSYNGFDFDSTGATKDGETAASDGTEDYWKIYTGSGNPLLKVFLTTVTVDADNLPNLVYNTKDQDLIIGSLIGENGAFSADDDFKAYQNNNSLIQNTDFEHKNAGTYDNWLYSQQIAETSSNESFNPNNLGYDIEFKADIDKAQITVDLNQVDRVYGNTDIINGEYGFSYGFNNVLSDADKTALIDELNKNSVLNMNDVNAATDDKALVENGTKTNDAGTYSWEGTVNIADGYESNYEFVVKDTGTISNEGATVTTTGDSIVNKRQLSVSDIIANIVYGNQDGKGFIVSGGELIGVNGNAGIVYDDKVKLDTSLKVEDANIIANSSYASNKGNRVTADAGTYENSLNFSGLGLSGDDANNYVLVNDSFGGTIEVTQATINVDLNDVDRIYGSTAFNGNGYAVSDVKHNANGDSYNANDFVVSVNVGNDGALTGNDTGKVTNDVGEYSYIGTVISKNEKLNQNYKIVVNNSEANNNIGSGVSTVSKADLSVTINNVDTVYGTAFDESKYGYTLDNLVNGDGNSSDIVNVIENAINNASGGYNNTGAADGTNGKVTQDAEGDYSLSFKNDITKEEILKNYNITTVTNGDANVSKKQISIGANDEEIHVGEVPVYTGTDINGVLVNGDKLSGDYHYGVADNAIESVVGKHNGVIGVWLNGTFYDLSLNTDWSKVSGLEFFSNYAVDYKSGTLTVTEQVMPDLPDNWPGNRWDYLFNDAPFDRNKNFRERKAEVNFVDGGMEV